MPVMKSIENLPLSELKQILTPEEIMELTGATLIKGKDGDSIKGDPGKIEFQINFDYFVKQEKIDIR